MVAIPTTAKLISTAVNAKSGTTVKKFLMPEYGKKAMATVVEYGANNPIKKKGIDSFVKITGTESAYAKTNSALFSGDKIILNGASDADGATYVGSFKDRFKEMVDLLKKYPKLTVDLISNTNNDTFFAEAINKFQG